MNQSELIQYDGRKKEHSFDICLWFVFCSLVWSQLATGLAAPVTAPTQSATPSATAQATTKADPTGPTALARTGTLFVSLIALCQRVLVAKTKSLKMIPQGGPGACARAALQLCPKRTVANGEALKL